ncbi:MAG: S41 family peptidase [Chloroflexota bacterium]
MTPNAQAYLQEALDIMEQYALGRDQIDWGHLRHSAWETAREAQTCADTHQAIHNAAWTTNEHSFLISPVVERRKPTKAVNTELSGEIVADRIGYIHLPKFSATSESEELAFATQMQNMIRQLDSTNPEGWIVDLRDNQGGNMWPMLAGIGPILGEGHVGSFVTSDHQHNWFYQEGCAGIDNETVICVQEAAYEVQAPMPPVAVLTSRETASSGEAITIAFRGRPKTRSFGQATKGRSTANQSFTLSDGAILVLTVSLFADRTGHTYGEAVVPDEIIPDRDTILPATIQWLTSQFQDR